MNSKNLAYWVAGGVLVLILIVLGFWVAAKPATPAPSSTATSTPQVATSTVATSTVSTTTEANSTSLPKTTVPVSTKKGTPIVEPPASVYLTAWNQFKVYAKCNAVVVASTATVHSFRNEAAPVKDNGAPAVKCQDGLTYIY